VYRSPGSASRHLCQVMLLLAYSFSGRSLLRVLWMVAGWIWLDPPPPRRLWSSTASRIQELEILGRVPGRCATADGFFYCDFFQSLCAIGSFQLDVQFVFFFGGGRRRRGGRAPVVLEGSRVFDVLCSLFKVLSGSWSGQQFMYPVRMCLYLYGFVYGSLTWNTDAYYQKKEKNPTLSSAVCRSQCVEAIQGLLPLVREATISLPPT
jgi:hypothetical protein